MPKYKTLVSYSTSLFKEKGSKFYGYAYPIRDPEKVKELLLQIQEEHPKARHICSAFLLGTGDQEYFLTNDDGEPSNSAGAPILGQIRSHDLTNVYIAVVRYFGGVKLGVGGLIQAYKRTAAEAIDANEIIEVEPESVLKLKVNYNELGLILSIIDKNNLAVQVNNETNYSIVSITCKEVEEQKIRSLFNQYNLIIKD